jgi:Family of unknown function (DUF6194)
MAMDQDAIIRYVTETFDGVEVVVGTEGFGAGDTFFFYDPNGSTDPTRRLPFATIVTKDYGEFDNASQLDRPGVFRLNVGVGRQTYVPLFGMPSDGAGYDFAALDRLLPHPVYASQWWVCVLNPNEETFQREIRPMLAEAHALAAKRHRSRRA